jgi:hypothetical protein
MPLLALPPWLAFGARSLRTPGGPGEEEREQLGRVLSVAREQRTERDVEWALRLFEHYESEV